MTFNVTNKNLLINLLNEIFIAAGFRQFRYIKIILKGLIHIYFYANNKYVCTKPLISLFHSFGHATLSFSFLYFARDYIEYEICSETLSVLINSLGKIYAKNNDMTITD